MSLTADALRGLQAVFADAASAMQEALRAPDGGGYDAGTRHELRSLQRMAVAAADPLVKLGRSAAGAAVRRLGSTSSLALTSSIGVLRVSVGALSSAGPPALTASPCPTSSRA